MSEARRYRVRFMRRPFQSAPEFVSESVTVLAYSAADAVEQVRVSQETLGWVRAEEVSPEPEVQR